MLLPPWQPERVELAVVDQDLYLSDVPQEFALIERLGSADHFSNVALAEIRDFLNHHVYWHDLSEFQQHVLSLWRVP